MSADKYEPDATDRGRYDDAPFRGLLFALAIMCPVYLLLAWLLWPGR